MTEIRESGFSLDLQGEWAEAGSDEPGTLAYVQQDGIGSVTVVLLEVRPMFAIADKSRLLTDYMQHRSQFEKGRIPTLEQTDPVWAEQDDVLEGSWSAIDPQSGARQIHRVVLAGRILADVSYQAAGIEQSEFVARAAAVLESASVGEWLEEADDAEE